MLLSLSPLLYFSLPIEGMKRKIMRQLRSLEQEEMVSSKDDYQEIINSIAKVLYPLKHTHNSMYNSGLHANKQLYF